ncbi:MAG: HAMP domain-containing sensor histidine kinase [Cyclobacteriaceae bacterium]
MSADHIENIPYSLALKCRFILVFGAIGAITTSSLFLYLVLTDPFANISFLYALSFAVPLLYATTYFAYKKRPSIASSLAILASVLGCFGSLTLFFASFLTLEMIFVLSAMFIPINRKQSIVFYFFIVFTVVIKVLAELKLFSVVFIPHSDLDKESIFYICMFLFSIFFYAFIVNYMINRGLQSSEKLIETSSQLKDTLKLKDQLITLISHDLKNPIGNITMIVKEIQRKTLPVTPKVLEMLNDTSSKASELIETLMQWSAVKQDNTMLRTEDFKLFDCVEETIGLVQIMSSQKEIEITNNCDKDVIASADRRMISTVVRNLLSNAIKFSHNKGTIKLSSDTDQDFIIIHIEDSGVGLSPEHQKKLFLNDHEHASSPGTSNEMGSGLGLIISKDFVALNGGDIGVESEQEKGSRFWFSIPMAGQRH